MDEYGEGRRRDDAEGPAPTEQTCARLQHAVSSKKRALCTAEGSLRLRLSCRRNHDPLCATMVLKPCELCNNSSARSSCGSLPSSPSRPADSSDSSSIFDGAVSFGVVPFFCSK